MAAKPNRGIYRLDRPALFALLPATGGGMKVSELIAAAGLGPEAHRAVESCIQEWKRWGAVHLRGRAKLKRQGHPAGLWVRVWSLERFAEVRAMQRRSRPCVVEPIPRRPPAAPPVVLSSAPMDYGAACCQVRSLGAMCEAWLRRE